MTDSEKIELTGKIAKSMLSRLASCDICPRNCKANRLSNQKGYCGTTKELIIYSAFLHQGEEPAISGNIGSGTIFFSGCSLKCLYCQNHNFSQGLKGETITIEDLAKVMLKLQSQGAHNINLVTPTHFLSQILKTLHLALKAGLKIPIVYNTSGYEKESIIKDLRGIVDIYLTDLKYTSPETGDFFSQAPQYHIFATKSIKEMYSQVGQAHWDSNLLKKGLIIRNLILPNYIGDSENALLWIKKNTPEALLSIMCQYQPYFLAKNFLPVNRKLTPFEYKKIKDLVEELGIDGWLQEFPPKEDLAGVYFKPNIGDLLK
tara:strand:- start:1574 stop:2524 length:951 start_codon:yes stop_codon:yes gene_type:complete